MRKFITSFNGIDLKDIPEVGDKNASTSRAMLIADGKIEFISSPAVHQKKSKLN
jgi:hypothetical protein